MSSFDPPLSRFSAALWVVAAVVVFAWVLYCAQVASTAKIALSTVEFTEREASNVNVGNRP